MRDRIELRPLAGFGFATLIGLVALGLWISPQALFGFPPRTDGFRPDFFGADGRPYWVNLTFRLIRMAVIVPFVEELFWRGFLLRYLVREDFASVPFGTFTWRSFLISSFAFCLEHQPSDWPAAVLTGALFNLVAYRTRSLAACVLTHAVTNLALAFYILRTGPVGILVRLQSSAPAASQPLDFQLRTALGRRSALEDRHDPEFLLPKSPPHHVLGILRCWLDPVLQAHDLAGQ